MSARFTGDLLLGKNSVLDDHVSSNTRLDADKLQHIFKPYTNFDLAIGATPVAREEIVFVCATAGVLRAFHCLLNDTGTSTDIDFDIKVNGVSALSAVVNHTHGDVDGTVKDGTIASAVLAADDIVSIEMVVTSATGAQGPFAWADIEELTV